MVRSWSARATEDGARAYREFFRDRLAPELERLPGHRGALVLARSEGDHIVITVLTFWDSMEAVTRFAGDSPSRAVVEPEAQALLLSFDEFVSHSGILLDTRTPHART